MVCIRLLMIPSLLDRDNIPAMAAMEHTTRNFLLALGGNLLAQGVIHDLQVPAKDVETAGSEGRVEDHGSEIWPESRLYNIFTRRLSSKK